MTCLFITGTHTGIGKTVVTRYLRTELLHLGYTVGTQKWVQTGTILGDNDQLLHGGDTGNDHICYAFQHPSSPHLAASLENKSISFEVISKAIERLSHRYDRLLIEGSGGLCVPVSYTEVLADWVAQLDIPTLLVVGNTLGCLNHALLSLHYMASRGIRCMGYVINTSDPSCDPLILENNILTLQKMSQVPYLGHLPYCEEGVLPSGLICMDTL